MTAPLPFTLVTGMPRSATTVVGRLLALPAGVVTLHEPLNGDAGLRMVSGYFDYIDRPDDPRATSRIDATVTQIKGLRGLRFKSGLFQNDIGLRGAAKRITGGRIINTWRRARLDPFKTHVIWKDPFAAFMTGHLARVHGIGAVITLRNPWATAASFKRMGWGMDLSQVRAATQGMERYGVPEAALAPPKSDHVGNAAAMWVMLYAKVLADLDARGPDDAPLVLLDLDRAIAAPVSVYKGLYATFDLPWSARTAAHIAVTYAPKTSQPRDTPKAARAHDVSRDPTSFNTYWKKLLSAEEAARVTAMAGPLWDEIRARLQVGAT